MPDVGLFVASTRASALAKVGRYLGMYQTWFGTTLATVRQRI